MDSPRSSEPLSPNRDGGIRKKMRKGTHSCFECRRRKIRCIFSPSNPSVCSECFARGSKCIDQEHADPNIVVDQRKNLRERVARLETMLESLLEELNDRKSNGMMKDMHDSQVSSTEVNEERSQLPRGGRAPIWTLLDNSIWAASDNEKAQQVSNDGVINVSQSREIEINNGAECTQPEATTQKKNERVSQILKNALPSQEVLLETLNANSAMWTNITSKMINSGIPQELTSIHAYAAFAMSNKGTPMDLAKILQFVAGQSVDEEIERLLNLIERLIVHDDEYMGTLSGIEVAMAQVRLYSDIGQARRAWLTTRRALDFAQLMGLHRVRVNVRQDFVFWGIFQNDRFSSLLLGTPYGISDVHCNLNFGDMNSLMMGDTHIFMTRLAIFAGRVVERTHGNQEPSFSSLLTIDNDLTRFGNQMPPEYWKLAAQAPAENMMWLHQAVSQLIYHQTRLILHIPYMLKSVTNGGYEYSRDSCFQSARDIVDVFLIMRHERNQFVGKARYVDFLCFMALVTLIIGLVSASQQVEADIEGAKTNPQANPKQQLEDWNRVDACIDTYSRISEQPFGKVARQSHRALSQLTKFRNRDASIGEEGVKVVVPFFGTITLKFPQREKEQQDCKERVKSGWHSHINNHNSNQHRSPLGSQPSRPHSPQSGHLPSPHSPSNGLPTMAHTALHQSSSLSSHSQSYSVSTPISALRGTPISPVAPHQVQVEPRIMYDGVYAPAATVFGAGAAGGGGGAGGPPFGGALPTSAGLGGGHLPASQLPSSYGWQNIGTCDIDQDWDWDAVNAWAGLMG